MAASRTASATSTEFASVTNMTVGITMTAGRHIVANSISWRAGTDQAITSVSDAANGAYTLGVTGTRLDSEVLPVQYYKNNIGTGGAQTVTIVWNAGCSGGIIVEEWSGVKTTPTVSSAVNTGSSTTMSTGAIDPTPSSLFCASAGYNTGGPVTIGAPGGGFGNALEFDENNDTQSMAVASLTASDASSTCTWSLSGSCTWTALVVCYEEDGAAPAGQPIQPRRAQVPFQGTIQPSFTGIR